MRRWLARLALTLVLLLLGPLATAMVGISDVDGSWRTARRDSAGLAPAPSEHPDAIVQVYGARAFGWRGAFAVHTWIATKRQDADHYTSYQVIGWRAYHGRPALAIEQGPPDRRWFGAVPVLYRDLRGAEVEVLIDRIEAAVEAYPFKDEYRVWPGPNSNSFTAAIGRAVPALRLDLPATAIGKDFLGRNAFAARAPSGTGYQLSLFGLAGLLVGLEEGLEVNLLGLHFGVDPLDLSLRLPGVGRLP